MYSYSEAQDPHMSLYSCTVYSEPAMTNPVMMSPVTMSPVTTSLVHVQLLRSAGSPHVPVQLHCVLRTSYDESSYDESSYNESGYDESGTCTATQKCRFPTCPHAAALCTPNRLRQVRYMYSYSEAQVPDMSLYSCTVYSEPVMTNPVMMSPVTMSPVTTSPVHVQLLRSKQENVVKTEKTVTVIWCFSYFVLDQFN